MKLYHYTSADGIKGVLESQSLWATHYKFLNDASEIVYFKNLFNKLFHEVLTTDTRFRDIDYNYETANMLFDVLMNMPVDGPFVTSFCSENNDKFVIDNGLLSQWRAYGPIQGFAIEFDYDGLIALAAKENDSFRYAYYQFVKCVYSEISTQNYESEFISDLELIKIYLGESIRAAVNRTYTPNHTKEQLAALIRCLCRFKHEGFREEGEHRIVFAPSSELGEGEKEEKITNFFKNKEIYVPYIKLFERERKLPITRIIIGPGREQEMAFEFTSELVKKLNLSIELKKSEIPYR